jgi:hypothetical protein
VVENRDGRIVPLDPRVMRIDKPHFPEIGPLPISESDKRNTAAELGARMPLVGRAAGVCRTSVGRSAAAVTTWR